MLVNLCLLILLMDWDNLGDLLWPIPVERVCDADYGRLRGSSSFGPINDPVYLNNF